MVRMQQEERTRWLAQQLEPQQRPMHDGCGQQLGSYGLPRTAMGLLLLMVSCMQLVPGFQVWPMPLRSIHKRQ